MKQIKSLDLNGVYKFSKKSKLIVKERLNKTSSNTLSLKNFENKIKYNIIITLFVINYLVLQIY